LSPKKKYNMLAYKFNTRISADGVITLPYEPQLFNSEVELIVLPKTDRPAQTGDNHPANDFLKKWSGAFKQMTDEEIDSTKYNYLKNKHK